MGKYALGGNVHDKARDNAAYYASAQYYAHASIAPASRWSRFWTFLEDWDTRLLLPLAIVLTVTATVFMILSAVAAQQVYALKVTATETGFFGHVVKSYNWDNPAGDTVGVLWLVFVGLAAVAWVLFFLVIREGVVDFIGMIVGSLFLSGLLLVVIGGPVAGIKHGDTDAASRMQDSMNNWIVNTLNVPSDINILDETSFTRNYLRYNPQHKAVYFTIKSTENTVKVIPGQR